MSTVILRMLFPVGFLYFFDRRKSTAVPVLFVSIRPNCVARLRSIFFGIIFRSGPSCLLTEDFGYGLQVFQIFHVGSCIQPIDEAHVLFLSRRLFGARRPQDGEKVAGL